METLNPDQIRNGLLWLRQQWPRDPIDSEEYALALSHLYPGELVAAIQKLPAFPRPPADAILEAAIEQRPVKKPPTKEVIRSVIAQARADLARAG